MANNSIGCPAPFRLASDFPSTGGFIAGRTCSDLLGPSCCLPCPITDWVYDDNFQTMTTGTTWINVAGIICAAFVIISFACLPVGKTHRHYLSVCLAIGISFMHLGFIVPLAAKPELCYNEITPNDMHTSKICGLSGALLIGGGWCGVMWVFLRSLALHLQICWQVVIGNTFMWCALAAGWGIPAVGLAIALAESGLSFRFGDTCHINHDNSLADFWIPLLVFAAFTVITQFATFGYCIKVYLASLADDGTTTNSSTNYTNSVRGTLSPRQAYRRVRRVIELQWRGILIVLIIIADVIFFAVVFVFMDDLQFTVINDKKVIIPWATCLVTNNGNKNACLGLAQALRVSTPTVAAVLVLLSINGIWLLLLLGRMTMFTGWVELIRGKVKPSNEFVSADANMYKDPSNYEMLGRDRSADSRTPDPFPLSPPLEHPSAALTKSGRTTPDFFGREARYQSPTRSFSNPKPPTAGVGGTPTPRGYDWDPEATQARPYKYPNGLDPLSMNKF